MKNGRSALYVGSEGDECAGKAVDGVTASEVRSGKKEKWLFHHGENCFASSSPVGQSSEDLFGINGTITPVRRGASRFKVARPSHSSG
jgi:hypothetical protein